MERRQDRTRLRVSLRRWGPTVVLELGGRLVIDARVQYLGDLTELMAGGGKWLLVLDLGGVAQMDCTGIGQLIALYRQVRRIGGRFALVNIETRQRRLLDMAGLLAFFPAFERPRTIPSRIQSYDVA